MIDDRAPHEPDAEGIFRGGGGLKFYYQRWRPPTALPRAVLALVHNPDDRSGFYPELVDRLVPEEYAVYGFDHREHRWPADRPEYLQEWGESREDVRAFLRMVTEQEPVDNLFLVGNGLGGLIALVYALHHPEGLRGVIAFEPVMGPQRTSPLLRRMNRFLARAWPRVSVSTPLDYAATARNPASHPVFQTDLGEHAGEIDQIRSQVGDLAVPHLIVHVGAREPDGQTVDGAADDDLRLQEVTDWLEGQLQ